MFRLFSPLLCHADRLQLARTCMFCAYPLSLCAIVMGLGIVSKRTGWEAVRRGVVGVHRGVVGIHRGVVGVRRGVVRVERGKLGYRYDAHEGASDDVRFIRIIWSFV